MRKIRHNTNVLWDYIQAYCTHKYKLIIHTYTSIDLSLAILSELFTSPSYSIVHIKTIY